MMKNDLKKSEIIRRSLGFLNEFKRNKSAVVGLIIVVIIVLTGFFAEYLAPYDPFRFAPGSKSFIPPFTDPNHILGTDELGRDVLSRVMFGGKTSSIIALVSASMAAILGVILGSIPGYYGGIVDDAFSRFFDIFMMIPRLILLIVIVGLLGANINNLIIIIGLTAWPPNAKVIRSQILSLKKANYVKAAKASGATDLQILFRHVIPNSLYPVITNTVLGMGGSILVEAGLSFMGLGDPNIVSWGQMILVASRRLYSGPWLAVFPGLMLVIFVLSLNLVSEGLNQALNPKLRKR